MQNLIDRDLLWNCPSWEQSNALAGLGCAAMDDLEVRVLNFYHTNLACVI